MSTRPTTTIVVNLRSGHSRKFHTPTPQQMRDWQLYHPEFELKDGVYTVIDNQMKTHTFLAKDVKSIEEE